MWEFLSQPDWAQRVRNPFNDINGSDIQTNIVQSICENFYRVGNVSQDKRRTYSGYYFLQHKDGPIQPGSGQPIDRAAWFGFVNTRECLRNYGRGHPSELITVYRKYKQYRLDGGEFNGRFIEVGADHNFLGYSNVNGLIAWIADFDKTWDKTVWIQTFKQVGMVGV